MNDFQAKTNRKKIRLQSVDYNNVGAYFLTICTQNRQCILSQIVSVGTSVPTHEIKAGNVANRSIVSKFVSTFKRFCNKQIGENIWQARSNDHIIRNEEDYVNHMQYIVDNPMQWYFDKLYTE